MSQERIEQLRDKIDREQAKGKKRDNGKIEAWKQERAQLWAEMAVADTMAGNAPDPTPVSAPASAIPEPIVSPGYDPVNWSTEVNAFDGSNLTAGFSQVTQDQLGINDQTYNGMSIIAANNAHANAQTAGKIIEQGIVDTGLRELQGTIDKELARMQYENEQLKVDKGIENSIWLDRTANLTSTRNQRIQAGAAMLSNV